MQLHRSCPIDQIISCRYPVRAICPDYPLLFHDVVFFLSEGFSWDADDADDWSLHHPSPLSSLWRSIIFTSNRQIIIIRYFQINFTNRPDCNSDTFSLDCTFFFFFIFACFSLKSRGVSLFSGIRLMTETGAPGEETRRFSGTFYAPEDKLSPLSVFPVSP